jgi:hypothetical protein
MTTAIAYRTHWAVEPAANNRINGAAVIRPAAWSPGRCRSASLAEP